MSRSASHATSVSGARAVLLVIVGGMLAGLSAGPAVAANDEAEGRRRFKRGQDLFLQGKYLDAAHEFEAGYAAAPRPLFLYSIGNSYRRAGDLAKAKRFYQQLLQAMPDFERRAEVEANLKAIDDALSIADVPAAPPPPTPPPAPAAAPTATPAAEPAAPVAQTPPPSPSTVRRVARNVRTGELEPNVMETPPPTPLAASEESDSVLKKPWFWVAVGVVLAGGGAAAYFGLRGNSSCPGTLCLTESKR